MFIFNVHLKKDRRALPGEESELQNVCHWWRNIAAISSTNEAEDE
jgi:hypothetical protein